MANFKLKFEHIFLLLSRGFLLLFLFVLMAISGKAQTMSVPENIQAALLPKVLKFNPVISEKATIKMLVVYDNNSQSNKDKFIKELGQSMEIKAIRLAELKETITGYDLVYFMPGIIDETQLCKTHKVLSVTGISQYVEQGLISLGFGVQNNKPKILVNLKSLEAEGQSLSSDILRIAKIFI